MVVVDGFSADWLAQPLATATGAASTAMDATSLIMRAAYPVDPGNKRPVREAGSGGDGIPGPAESVRDQPDQAVVCAKRVGHNVGAAAPQAVLEQAL